MTLKMVSKYYFDTIFNPIIDPINKKTKNNRQKSAGSL